MQIRKNSHLALFAALLSMVSFTIGCSSYQPLLSERPIRFGPERQELTRSYLEDRYGIRQEGTGILPQMIVLHWTAIPDLEQSFDAFYPERLPDSRGDITGAGALNVSAHYLVDRDGSIYHLMPDTVMARHVIGLNHCAIGIENVGGTPETPLTPAQEEANEWLVRRLSARYPITYLIGHYEYTAFEGHPLWMEVDSGYRTEKTDPGTGFMKRIRKAVRDLNLRAAPKPFTE